MKRKSQPLLCLFLLSACCGAYAQVQTFNTFKDEGKCLFKIDHYSSKAFPTVLAPPDLVNTYFYNTYDRCQCADKASKKDKKKCIKDCQKKYDERIFLNYNHHDQDSIYYRNFQIKYNVLDKVNVPTEITYTTRIAIPVDSVNYDLTLALSQSDPGFFSKHDNIGEKVSAHVIKLNAPDKKTDEKDFDFAETKYSNSIQSLLPNSLYDVVITITNPPAATDTITLKHHKGKLTSYDYNHVFDLFLTRHVEPKKP